MKRILLISIFLVQSCTHTLPVMVTSNKVEGQVYKGCTTSLFALTLGEEENLIYQITDKNGLEKISSVDTTRFGVYPIYWEDCTFVQATQKKGFSPKKSLHKHVKKRKKKNSPSLEMCEGLDERDYEECVERAFEK